MAPPALTHFHIPPRPRWRGFSFALHRHGAGLFFLPGNISFTHKRSQRIFCYQCNFYTAQTSKAFTGLYRGFSVDLPHSSVQQYSSYTNRLYTACYTLDSIPSSAAPPPIPDTTATPDAIQVSAAAYYNKVYKGATYRKPCQPGGGLDTFHAWLNPWRRISLALARHTSGIMFSSWHGRRGTTSGYRRVSFRAFAR